MIRKINQSSKVCRRGQRTGVRRNTALILSLLLLWAMMPTRFLSTVAQPRASSNPTVQNEEKITTLELGQLIERELTENETHIYQIHLTSGQFLRVVVDQRGIDVAVALFAPDGQMMTEVASPNGTQGLEPISVVTKMSGGYRLEVRSLEKTAAGCYEVKVEALREATMQDKAEALAVALAAAKTEEERAGLLTQEKQLVTATLPQTLNNQGKQLESQGNYAQALALFFLALNIAERINDKAESAAIFNNIGLVYAAQGNYAQAMKYYQESLTLSEAQGLKTDVARALGNIGRVHSNQGNYAQAMEYYQKSLTLSEESGDKEGIARVLGSIGVVHRAQSNYAEALEYYQKSLALSVEIGDRWRIATILGNIGYVHHLQGNYAAALEHYQKNLKLNEEFGNRWGIATALGNIGDVYLLQGNYDEAMQYARQSLELNEKLGIKGGISRALNIISLLYLRQRNYTQALEYFHKSLALLEEIGHKSAIADTMSNIGTVYSAQGNLTQAMDYYQKSLTLREELGNKLGITFSLRNLGNIYMAQGNYVLALKFYQQCLHLNEEIGNKSGIVEALKGLGNIYERQGNHRQALEFVERAAAIARQINSRELLREARIIAGISYRALQQSVQSRRAFEEAIAVTEALRSNIAGQEARASFFATVQQPYELYIDLLMQQHKEHPSAGHDALALQMNERVRARTLLEALSEARADIRQGIDPVLRVRATTLQQQLNARAEHQTRLLSGKYTAEQAAALKKEINALTAEYQDVQAQIRRHSPRYAALTQPQPLTVRELQTGILDAETLLLEYALGEERSYVWAMTQTTLHSYELPKRAEIEDAVRGFYSLVSDNQRWRESAQASVQYRKASERLSQMLLVPIRSHLTSKRLVIVADGALQYVPFGALPAPSAQVSGVRDRVSEVGNSNRHLTPDTRHPLIVEHEIVSLPSASTISLLRQDSEGRARATKVVAVLADPVFAETDARVRRVEADGKNGEAQVSRQAARLPEMAAERNAEMARAVRDIGLAHDDLTISRLPFTRREAEAIFSVAPPAQAKKVLDFEASRAMALSDELADYRFVHFATHGLLDSTHPELSGIVLSLVNEAGQPVAGFLRLNEIYNLKLNAELVVLSACRTGLGKEIKGEGLIGLTRGFMYAGSPRVVASLWKVDDVATAELMKRFYQKMLRDHLRPAAALRAAQVEMWRQPRWQSPYYWAAFQLQGEWK